MARPVKNNAMFFFHETDASSDEKILYLESRHGVAAYAFYFKMLETLSRADNFFIPYNDITLSVLSKKFGIDLEVFNKILDDCLKPEISLLIINDNILFSPGLVKRMQPLMEKRKKSRKSNNVSYRSNNPIYGINNSDNNEVTESITPQNRLDYNRVDKNIEEKNNNKKIKECNKYADAKSISEHNLEKYLSGIVVSSTSSPTQ